MRFLSPHPGYSVQVFAPQESVEHDQVSGRAYTLVQRQPLVANFEAGFGLFPHEVELALEKFTSVWNGLPENVNPATKIAVYDTEAHKVFQGWSDEYHQAVVDRLIEIANFSPSRLVAVNDKWHPKPWPAYDNQDAGEILAFVNALGINPESVRLYEAENQIREDLILALQRLSDGLPAEPTVYQPPVAGSGDPEDLAEGTAVAVIEA